MSRRTRYALAYGLGFATWPAYCGVIWLILARKSLKH